MDQHPHTRADEGDRIALPGGWYFGPFSSKQDHYAVRALLRPDDTFVEFWRDEDARAFSSALAPPQPAPASGAERRLIEKLVDFADHMAGEGVSAVRDGGELDPARLFMDYAEAAGIDDSAPDLADLIKARLIAASAPAAPVAVDREKIEAALLSFEDGRLIRVFEQYFQPHDFPTTDEEWAASNSAKSAIKRLSAALLPSVRPRVDEGLRHALASLVAAISILQRSYDEKRPPNKVVASDKMFIQMLADYNNAVNFVRSLLAAEDAAAPEGEQTGEGGR